MTERTEQRIEGVSVERLGRLFGCTVRYVMLGLAVWTVVSICYLNLVRLLPSQLSATVASAVMAGILVVLTFASRFRIVGLSNGLLGRRIHLSVGTTFVLALIAGLVMRALWMVFYDPPLRSDMGTYWGLAERLYDGRSYLDPRGDSAYWPPGLPFWLYLNFQVFGIQAWVLEVGNAILYLVMAFTVFRSAWLMGVSDAGLRWVGIWVAIWPAMTFAVGLNSKELLLAALLPSALYFYLLSVSASSSMARRLLCLLLSGVFMGAACLTQPSFLLLPSIFVVDALYRQWSIMAALRNVVVVGLGMVICIGPWTARNFEVFDSFVPIATNGGDVFYRANNPLANGQYLAQGEVDLRQYGEIERNRLGAELGKKWIRDNPGEFLLLAVKKQVVFLGDSSTGVYETLKRGLEIEGKSYMFWKALSNGFWLLLWLLLLVAFLVKRAAVMKPDYLLLQLPFLYFFLIDSIFESGSRHNLPIIPLLLLLSSAIFAPHEQQRTIEAR